MVGIRKVKLSNLWDGGSINGKDEAGGLVGYSTASIEECYSDAQVNYGKGYNVGGLVGKMGGGSVENCYSSGVVRGSSRVGGLVGSCDYKSVVIKNSYSLSEVNGGSVIGGLVGEDIKGSQILNSYWVPEKAGVESSAGGSSLSLEDMNKQSSYEGFDFTSDTPTWTMKEFPELTFLVNK